MSASETVAGALPLSRHGLPSLHGDERLARLATRGDQSAFEAIFRRYHQELYRYCRAIVADADDAHDALQSTMAAALRALPGSRREIALRPWLYRVAHNEAISIVRRRSRAVDPELITAGLGPGADLEAESRERLRRLVSNLTTLPERQRGALIMRELSGLGYGEIAEALGLSEPGARQAVYEARIALRELEEGARMECDAARRVLSERDRRMLRGRRLRAHLKACEGCRDFQAAISQRRSDFEVLAPPLSIVAASGLLGALVGEGAGSAVGAGAGGVAGTAGAASTGAGAAGAAGAGSVALKAGTVVAAIAVGAGAAGGVGGVDLPGLGGHDRSPPGSSASDHGAGARGGGGADAAHHPAIPSTSAQSADARDRAGAAAGQSSGSRVGQGPADRGGQADRTGQASAPGHSDQAHEAHQASQGASQSQVTGGSAHRDDAHFHAAGSPGVAPPAANETNNGVRAHGAPAHANGAAYGRVPKPAGGAAKPEKPTSPATPATSSPGAIKRAEHPNAKPPAAASGEAQERAEG